MQLAYDLICQGDYAPLAMNSREIWRNLWEKNTVSDKKKTNQVEFKDTGGLRAWSPELHGLRFPCLNPDDPCLSNLDGSVTLRRR